MGLYNSGFDFRFNPDDRKKIFYALGTIIAAALLLLLLFFAYETVKAKPVEISFQKNPVKSGEQSATIVTVSNTTEMDAENVLLSLAAKEKTEFQVFPMNEKFNGTIKTLSAGTSRQVTFVLNPNGDVLPGSYSFVATAVINGQISEAEGILQVTK